MDVAPVVLLGSLIMSFVDFLKFIRSGDTNGWVTQLIAWAAGLAGVFLVAETVFATVKFGDHTLAAMGGWDKVVVGLMASSLFSVTHKAISAIRGSGGGPNLLPARFQRRGLGDTHPS